MLDVNQQIALCHADHVHRSAAKQWFRQNASAGWATCPLTENGLLRVMGHPAYPGGPGAPEAIRPLLQHLCSLPGHQFWADDISLTNEDSLSSLNGVASKHLTDLYLLALAVQHGASFATLDSHIDPTPVRGGSQALLVILS